MRSDSDAPLRGPGFCLIRGCELRLRVQPPRRAHDRSEAADELERLAAFDQPLQLAQLRFQPLRIDRWPTELKDRRMRRREDIVAVRPKLLVQLLARPCADDVDRDLALGLL